MAIEFKLTGTRELKDVLDNWLKDARGIPAEIRAQLRQVGRERGAGSGAEVSDSGSGPALVTPGGGDSPETQSQKKKKEKEAEDKRLLTEKAHDKWNRGQSVGEAPAADLAMLRQGDFAGVLNRGLGGLKNVQQLLTKKKKKKEEEEQDSSGIAAALAPGGESSEGGPAGALSGSRGTRIGRMHVERFELGAAGARTLARAIERGLRGSAGGGGFFGGGGGSGGGGGGEGRSSFLGGAATRVASAVGSLPWVGIALGAAAAAAGLISSINQMREASMSAQGGTIGAVGLVNQGAGGRIMNNAEMGSALLSAGQVTGSRGERGLAGEGGAFGLSVGMGGAEGARIYAQARQYGSAGSTGGTLLGAADVSGFGGLRRGRYAQDVAEMAESSAREGHGRLDLTAFGELTAGLHNNGRGLSGESALGLARSLQGGFQQKGSTLQNLALAAGMGRGKSYMQALVGAEAGATRENLAGVHGLLGLGSMDPETRAIIEQQIAGSTATQAMGAAGGGGIFNAQALGQGRVRAGSADLQMPSSYQDMISRQNKVDEILFAADNIAKVANTATEKLLQAASTFTSAVDKLIGGLTSYQ